MNDLFLSEWRRFRRHTLVVALVHVLLLLFLSRVTNPLQLGAEDQGMMLAVYMLLGLLLAVLQVGSYRKPSQWLWLIHRPLAPTRIFMALELSALAMLAVAVLLPLLAFVLATDLLTTKVVDGRHYVALVHVLAFALMAWLAGALACVGRRKAMVVVLIVPLVLALHMASVWALLLPVSVCLAWLTWIGMHSFRADREAPIARPAVLMLTALPLQIGFFVLVFQLGKLGLEAADQVRRNAAPAKTVLAGDVDADAQMRSMSQDLIIQGLEGSRDPRAAAWRRQLPLLDVAELTPDVERFPVRHQISNLGARWWDDKRSIEWTFSHDRMMFSGRDPKTGADRGWWGEKGVGVEQPFGQIPIFSLTPNALYAVDDTAQVQHELVRLPEGESFVGRPVQALDRLLLLTSKRVLAYRSDWRSASSYSPPVLDWQLTPAAQDDQLVNVSLVELMDGWLVSFFYYPSQEFDGFKHLGSTWQQVFLIDADGASRLVGERRDIRGVNIVLGTAGAVPRASWWVSPPLYALGRWPESVIDQGLTRPTRLALQPVARGLYSVAAVLMLISVALGYWWLRGARISARRRGAWLAGCALLGLPAFLSLLCLEPRAPQR